MSPIHAVLFDKDGTLFDFSRTWEAWALAFLSRLSSDETHREILASEVGFDLTAGRFARDSIAIAGTPMDVADLLAPHLPDMSTQALVALMNDEAAAAPQAEAVPLHPFLTALRAKQLSLGVVTNDAEAPALAHLRTAGVVELFDFIAGCDSGFGAKPEPGQLLAFADRMDLRPEHIVMVGDSTHDLVAARKAGMRGVGVLTGLADAETLAPFAEAVLPDIGHLPDWIDALPA